MRRIHAMLPTAVAFLLGAALTVRAQGEQPPLVGLPEYGVELEGTAEVPIIVNHSGKTIIGSVVQFKDKDGRGPHGNVIHIDNEDDWIADGKSATTTVAAMQVSKDPPRIPLLPDGARPPRLTMGSPTPIVQAVLEAVVFRDGHFVGPSSPSSQRDFDNFAVQVRFAAEIGAQVTAVEDKLEVDKVLMWEQVITLSSNRPDRPGLPVDHVNHRKWATALNLVQTRNSRGEAAAFKLAEHYASLPALWK